MCAHIELYDVGGGWSGHHFFNHGVFEFDIEVAAISGHCNAGGIIGRSMVGGGAKVGVTRRRDDGSKGADWVDGGFVTCLARLQIASM